MDVVRSKIEALSGHVDVETHIDEGSVFKIKLPLTLAIIQAMLVRVQEEMYAIPLTSIDSTINIEPSDIQTIQNKEVIVLRGEIIPIIRMEELCRFLIRRTPTSISLLSFTPVRRRRASSWTT